MLKSVTPHTELTEPEVNMLSIDTISKSSPNLQTVNQEIGQVVICGVSAFLVNGTTSWFSWIFIDLFTDEKRNGLQSNL